MLNKLFRAVFPRKVPATVAIAIVKTADWWIETLRNPIFTNGEPRLAAMWADTQANHVRPTEESLNEFRLLLVDHLIQKYQEHGSFGELGVKLHVDYHVDGILAELGQKAGIPYGSYTWPVKTMTHLRGDSRKGLARGWMAGHQTNIFAY